MLRRLLVRVVFCGTTLALIAGARAPARAQTPDVSRVRGRIVLIAGTDLHMERISGALLHAGDTLVVQRGGVERGRLRVLAADSSRAVVGFLAAPFALTRGEVLEAELRPGVGRDTGTPPAPGAPVPAVAPVAAPVPAAPLRGAPRPGPRASGYLSTETRWVAQRAAGATDSYAVPAASLYLRVTDLPNRSSVQVFGHVEHYGAHAPGGYGATELRLYTARLETAAGPLLLGLGRLTSRHDAASGAWDGISVSAGSRFAIAAEAGFEPERQGAAPVTRFPRVGLSAQVIARSDAVRYRGSIGALHYVEEVPAQRGASALFTRQSLSAGVLSVSGDVRVEKNDSGPAILRWGSAWASVRGRSGAMVHVGYRRYSPMMATPDSVRFAPRNRIEAGGHVPLGRVGITLNATASPDAAEPARSISARIGVRRLPGDVGAEVDAGVWEHDALQTTTAGLALDRTTGRLYTRAAYRLERSTVRAAANVHELETDVSIVLGGGSSLGLYATRSVAGDVTGTRAQLRLTWGF